VEFDADGEVLTGYERLVASLPEKLMRPRRPKTAPDDSGDGAARKRGRVDDAARDVPSDDRHPAEATRAEASDVSDDGSDGEDDGDGGDGGAPGSSVTDEFHRRFVQEEPYDAAASVAELSAKLVVKRVASASVPLFSALTAAAVAEGDSDACGFEVALSGAAPAAPLAERLVANSLAAPVTLSPLQCSLLPVLQSYKDVTFALRTHGVRVTWYPAPLPPPPCVRPRRALSLSLQRV
jgi:hypothetical protein